MLSDEVIASMRADLCPEAVWVYEALLDERESLLRVVEAADYTERWLRSTLAAGTPPHARLADALALLHTEESG